jgi:hypothetical protein
MKHIVNIWVALMIVCVVVVSMAYAETSDTFIKQLKDSSPEVRGKAAQELGYG